jgi:putative ABC transport system ATP-binding protein
VSTVPEPAPARALPSESPLDATGPGGTSATPPSPEEPPARRVEPPVAFADNLTKVYGADKTAVVALDQVSVAFQLGSFTAIMGPSGSGKSTLMHCLAGLDRITSGRVVLAGLELQTLPDRQLTRVRRDKIGFVFQAFNLLPTLTASQNITLPLELAGRKPEDAWFEQLVTSLGIQDRMEHRPSELSGGEQQRVAIARALITHPDVVFADEPTGALDSQTSRHLLEYLRSSSTDLGQTIIMVTHDPKAAAYADRALLLLDGHIVDDIPQPTVDILNASMARLEA